MGKIISFINYKGGVGKTTTTYHIGCALALYHNKRILLIDTDPQTNLTFLCAIPEQWEVFKRNNGTISGVFNAYLKDAQNFFDIEKVIWKSPIKQTLGEAVQNLDLLPSDIELLGIDIDLASKMRMKHETGFYREQIHILRRTVKRIKNEFGIDTSDDFRDAYFYVEQRHILRKAIDRIKDTYDYILIDCPPNLYLVTQNALFASDYYIITTMPDHLSTIGINILINKITHLNDVITQKYRIIGSSVKPVTLKGLLFTMIRKSGPNIVSALKEKIELLRKIYHDLCFNQYISLGTGYTEAAASALPVFLMEDSNATRVAMEYREVAKEFLEKVGGEEYGKTEKKTESE